jgi:methyl-accepting chemotaxis protein
MGGDIRLFISSARINSMSFLNLRIRGRLYGGFGALVLFCAALAIFAVWQLWTIQDHVGSMTVQSKNIIRVGQITADLQAIRRAILRYNFDHDEPSFADAEKLLADTSDLLDVAIKETRSDELRATYTEVQKEVTELKLKRVALGDAVKQLTAAKASLFTDGDKMAADVQKFVDAAEKTDFAHEARSLEAKVLLVRVANWRLLATRDAKGVATFKTNAAKAAQQIAELEKSGLPQDLAGLVPPVKAGVAKYSDAFEKASTNLLLGDEVYYKAVTPLTKSAVDKMDRVEADLGKAFSNTSKETNDGISVTVTIQQVVAGVATLLGLLIAFFIARGIVGPLSGLNAGMQQLARGNFDVLVPGVDRQDELGEMARTVEVFKKNGLEVERMKAEQTASEQRTAQQRKADMQKLADGFEAAVGRIVETVSSASTELEASAGTLTSAAERAQALTTAVAAASEEATTNVQSVASATEELTSSVNEISRQVQESARMANEAVDQARRTNDRVGQLSKAAARIGDVVELINTIAGQTNLLALNATIEAARAGEAGRGFAVVASEVKALAEQTAKATGEIGQQISGIQNATAESVGAIKEISGTIAKLSEISSTIAAAVEEQGAATQEISRNVQHAAQGTQQVSSNITDVQRGASETGSASSQVLSAAKSLSGESNRLKLEVGKFLTAVRAA